MNTNQAAQQTAERNAERMRTQGYSYEAARTAGFFWVKRPQGGKYLVDSVSGRCECPYYAEHGVCKHGVFVADGEAWAASVETREAEYTRPVDAIA